MGKPSEEEKLVSPGDEEPTKPSEEEKLLCPGDENITYEEVDPLKILELKRSHEEVIIQEDKPVSPGDEEHTKPSEEEELVSPGDEEPTKPSTPVKLVEVVQNKGEVTIFKEKSKKKKWNP